MSVEVAARVTGMSVKRARRLQTDPNFVAALKSAVEAYRKTLEPGSIAMALSIRDDPTCTPKEQIKAAEFLYGPKAAPGVVINNNLQQNNNLDRYPAGYVIDLTGFSREDQEELAKIKARRLATQPAGKIIDITGARQDVGDIARDVEAERADAAKPRPSRE